MPAREKDNLLGNGPMQLTPQRPGKRGPAACRPSTAVPPDDLEHTASTTFRTRATEPPRAPTATSRAFPKFESYAASPRGAVEGGEPGVHNPRSEVMDSGFAASRRPGMTSEGNDRFHRIAALSSSHPRA